MAITVWQPWATLIAIGAKPYEFRGHPAPRGLWGQRVAIHAGARPVRRSEVVSLMLDLLSLARRRETGLEHGPSLELLERVLTTPRMLPLSSILCTAILGQPIRDAELAKALGIATIHDSDRGEHSSWGWPLTDVQPLRPIVPARGAQGWWNWSEGAA